MIFLICRICGIRFKRVTNNQKYCNKCAIEVNRKKARIRLRRKRELGTSDFFEHRCKDFDREYEEIQKEKKRIGLK